MVRAAVLILLCMAADTVYGRGFEQSREIEEVFKRYGAEGTFIYYDLQNGVTGGWNEKRAGIRYQPASTFKIINALIGLSEGVVESTREEFYTYEGEEVYLESWARDSDLRYGMKVSHVPAYQELARGIGLERMQENIEKIGYGNNETGDVADTFWLEGPLQISALEQTEVLARLVRRELPFETTLQDEVYDILKMEVDEGYSLYGKTGWAASNIDTPVGWFAGWAETGEGIYVFALNMDVADSEDLWKREEIARESLKVMGVIEE